MKVIFAGTPDFAAGHLASLIGSHHELVAVISQPDRPGKRGKQPVASPVKQIAEAAGLSVLQPQKLQTTDLDGLDFDILVVVAYGQILTTDILRYPRYGCINVHASLLPRWRGAAPVQRSILEGDKTTGVTIMEIDEGLDTGDMLLWREFEIASDDTSASLFQKMLNMGQPLLIEALDRLEEGSLKAVPQDDSKSCYARKITKEEAQLDWNASNAVIDRKVRGYQPDPVAYTFLGDMRVKIHRGQPVEGSGKPGTIINVTKNGISVACGEGAYLIDQVQLPLGKGKVLDPMDVLNGRTDLLHAGAGFSNE